MAALHSALQILGPAPYSSIPTEKAQAKDWLQDIFAKAQLIIDSVPPPPVEEPLAGRPRSNTTTSDASNISEISASSARSEPTEPSHAALRTEWGKPIKLAAKDNPLGIAVYKLGGKDGRGAWFARSSVHEGLDFDRWKLGFEHEFPESLAVEGGPGEGNIRGIGGERRVEDREVSGVGKVQGLFLRSILRYHRTNGPLVYQLSAQFPGPTTPRDFVTLLITSSSALCGSDHQKLPPFSNRPKHFMIVSKPCIHPECPSRDGFIRGQYESVEFIRELPRKLKKSSSTRDLSSQGTSIQNGSHITGISEEEIGTARRRSKTVSIAKSNGAQARGEAPNAPHDESDDEGNPIEWTMITRSDPGGSVPRFMVERGTPGGIVTDAGKFLDWACRKEHPITEPGAENAQDYNQDRTLEAPQTNGHLAGLETPDERIAPRSSEQEDLVAEPQGAVAEPPGGFFASITNAAKAGVETYAPQAMIDRLGGSQQPQPSPGQDANGTLGDKDDDDSSISTTTMSFASAEEGINESLSTHSSPSQDASSKGTDPPMQSRHERELAKLNERKKALNEKFANSREKESRDKEVLTSKEQERLRKGEEKHQREITKQEEKYKKEVAKLEAKRVKEASKEEDKRKKEQDKNEKARLTRERDEARQELDVIKQERDLLSDQMGALQRENTSLVARLGKLGEGGRVLRAAQAEVASGSRSRSSSLQSLQSQKLERGPEATIIGSEKTAEVLH